MCVNKGGGGTSTPRIWSGGTECHGFLQKVSISTLSAEGTDPRRQKRREGWE